jgi:hypothetical protein
LFIVVKVFSIAVFKFDPAGVDKRPLVNFEDWSNEFWISVVILLAV